MVKCPTSKHTHRLLFLLLMLHTEKVGSEPWLLGCRVMELYELQYCSASLLAVSTARWCQP